jgi:hypothetical protein
MNLYSKKQKWKILLVIAALIIAGASIWYANDIAKSLKENELTRVNQWGEAISKKADLVKITN